MNTNFVKAKKIFKKIAAEGTQPSGNGELFWQGVDALLLHFPLMRIGKAQSWAELFIARAKGCPVALGLKGPRTGFDPFYTVKVYEVEPQIKELSRTNQVLNLTQHQATPDQLAAGVVEPADKSAVQTALTFDVIPTPLELEVSAQVLATIAVESGCKRAMIGGAPFFMAPLERALLAAGITPVYAFSVRDSVEQPDGSGGVRKVNVFRHVGFVEASV